MIKKSTTLTLISTLLLLTSLEALKYGDVNDNDCTEGACSKCTYVSENVQRCSQCVGVPMIMLDQERKLGKCDTSKKIAMANCDI